jgi:hypothetical protein
MRLLVLALAMVGGVSAGPKKDVPKETNLKQQHFYFNNISHVSQWARPMEIPHRDKKTGRQYWSVFGQVTWDAPSDLAWRTVPYNSSLSYFENYKTKERTWDRPLVLGWSKRSVANSYWVNTVSNSATRTVPYVVGFTDSQANRYFVNPKTKQPQWEKPVEAAWVEKDSDAYPDRTFFFNEVSKQSTWQMPEDSNLAWVEIHDELNDDEF